MATQIVSHKGHIHVTDHPKRALCLLLPIGLCFVNFQYQKWSLFPSAILSLSIILSAIFYSLFLLLHAKRIWLDCVVVSSGSPMVSLPDYILLHKLPQFIQSTAMFNGLLSRFPILFILRVPRNILGYLSFGHLNSFVLAWLEKLRWNSKDEVASTTEIGYRGVLKNGVQRGEVSRFDLPAGILLLHASLPVCWLLTFVVYSNETRLTKLKFHPYYFSSQLLIWSPCLQIYSYIGD